MLVELKITLADPIKKKIFHNNKASNCSPLWQVDVWGISTDGLSQKAAIMLRRQNPGQRVNGCEVVLRVVGAGVVVVVVEEIGGFLEGGTAAALGAGLVIQHESSPGHVASVSISSQNSANSPLTHSPLHACPAG